MRRDALARALAGAVWACGLLGPAAASARAQFRTPEWQDFHNSTFVGPEDEEPRRALFAAEEFLRSGRSLEAGREWLHLLGRDPEALVRFGERLVLPVHRAVAFKLHELPEATREELRVFEQAAAEERARRSASAADLRDLAQRFPLSPEGEAALYQLGQRQLLDGEPAAAAACFEELVQWPAAYPGTLRVLAAARLLECLGLQREGPPPESPLLRWPTGEVLVEGRPRPLSELRFPAPALTGWPTLGGSHAHTRRAVHPSVPEPRYCFPFPAVPGPERASHRHRFDVPNALGEKNSSSAAPVLWNGRWISAEFDGVHVRFLATGQDEFPPLAYDFDLHVDPHRFQIDRDRTSLCVAGDMLYLTVEATDATQYPLQNHGSLYGIDLAREGYVTFAVRPWDQPEHAALQGYTFAGPVVTGAGRVLVPATRLADNDTECHLLAFDARTGELDGDLFLARAAPVARYSDRFSQEPDRQLVPAAPAAEENGVAYVCTNLGVVAAVRVADLSLQWIFRYNRLLPMDSQRYTREVFYVTGGWPNHEVLAFPDRVLVSPTDSRYLYSLARWPNPRGDLVLNEPVEKETRLGWLGADPSRLFFLVKRGPEQAVQATDHSGAILWETPPLPAAEPVAGLPALSARHLYLPTDKRVYRMDLEQNGFVDQVLAPPDAVGVPNPRYGVFGDLTAVPGFLFSVSSGFGLAFEVPE